MIQLNSSDFLCKFQCLLLSLRNQSCSFSVCLTKAGDPIFLLSFCKANTFFPKCFLFSVLSTQKADTLQIPLSLPAIRWAKRGRSSAPSTCSRCEFNLRWHFPCRGVSLRDTSQLRPGCSRPQLGQTERVGGRGEGETGDPDYVITSRCWVCGGGWARDSI